MNTDPRLKEIVRELQAVDEPARVLLIRAIRGVIAGTFGAEHVARLEATMTGLDERGRREALAGLLMEVGA